MQELLDVMVSVEARPPRADAKPMLGAPKTRREAVEHLASALAEWMPEETPLAEWTKAQVEFQRMLEGREPYPFSDTAAIGDQPEWSRLLDAFNAEMERQWVQRALAD